MAAFGVDPCNLLRRIVGFLIVLAVIAFCVSPSSAAITTFTPVADVEVNSSLPSVNFGRATGVGLDGSPVRAGYLRFDVSVPPGEVVTSATLRLFMGSSSSSNGVFVHQVYNTTWGETTTTYANAPALGAQVAASGAFPANAYVSMDVTSLVSASGLVSLGVTRNNAAAIAFSSREAAANQPQLVVLTAAPDGTAPTVSMAAPASGSTVSGSAVTVSAEASDNVGVVGVQFRLDGADLGAEDLARPTRSPGTRRRPRAARTR